jgi:4a-hydroxytetrahydrobiopterin dehydratase
MSDQRLDREQIRDRLERQPGWVAAGSSLHTTITAPDFPAAVDLVSAIGQDAETAGHHPDLDLRWRQVRVTLSTHSAGGVTRKDLDLAGRISARAQAAGASLDAVAPATVTIGIDCTDAAAILPFWQAVLDYTPDDPDDDGDVSLSDPRGAGPQVWFQHMDPPRRERSRIHVDVYVPEPLMATRRDAALAAGGTLLDDSHGPHWWVLADAEGNEACICRA